MVNALYFFVIVFRVESSGGREKGVLIFVVFYLDGKRFGLEVFVLFV